MLFPLEFLDISLLLAVTAIILLATSELISPYYSLTGLIIEKRPLKTAAIILGALFLSTVAIRIYQVILT